MVSVNIRQMTLKFNFPDKSFMCISTLDKNLVGVSIKFRSEESVLKRSSSCELTPSPPDDAKASTEKQCLMTALAPMTSARCGLGTAVLDDRLIALGENRYFLV